MGEDWGKAAWALISRWELWAGIAALAVLGAAKRAGLVLGPRTRVMPRTPPPPTPWQDGLTPGEGGAPPIPMGEKPRDRP